MQYKYRDTPRLLEGRVAIVTGASKGIGAGIATAMAAAGAAVVVNYARDRAGAERVVGAIESVGHIGPAVGVDDGSDVGDLIEAFLEKQTAGAKFVVARTVAWLACDEEDFFRFVRGEASE